MLTINIDGLEQKVKPELNNSEKNVKSARELLTSIKIPSDFTYYSRLRSIPSTLLEIEEKMEEAEKWIDERIKMFTSAEKNNNGIVNSIIETYNNILKNVDLKLDDINYAINQEIKENYDKFAEAGDKLVETGGNLSESDNIALVAIGNVLSKLGEDIENGEIIFDIRKYAEKTNATIGSNISSAIESLGDGLKSVGATIANGVIGLVKGLAELIQSLIKGIVLIAGAGALIMGAGSMVVPLSKIFPIVAIGIVLYEAYKASGGDTTKIDKFIADTKAIAKATVNLILQSTMGFIAEDYVGNAFDWFYNTKAGETLDKYAIDVFESDGIGTNIVSGVGYVAGIIAIALFTGGAGGVLAVGGTTGSAAGTVGLTATIAGVSGFGKYTSEKWAEFRDESWDGINRLYEKGEITEEQYNSFVYIRGLTDEGWAEIENAYKNGEIGEEEFALMKQIRELPEDWATAENAFKGITYGAASGLWEGIQWYLGGKLSTFALKGASNLANSTMRVGIDSAFNTADTPYRALIDSAITGKDYEQAWVEQGGWQALLSNFGIGLLGSVGGEVFDNLRGKVNTETSLSSEVYTRNNLADEISIPIFGKINTIDDAIKFTLKRQGLPITSENIQFIKNKINNGEFNYITKVNGARDKVIELLKQTNINSEKINTIDDAIKFTLNKQGLSITPENIKKLRDRIYSGDYNCITRTNGARDRVIQLTEQIKSLVNVLNTGKMSDPKVVNLIQDSFEKWIENNIYAEQLANQLIKLKKKNPDLTFEIDSNGDSYWNGYELTLSLGENIIKWGASSTLAHETGHLLFYLVLDEKTPRNWDSIVEKARVLSSNVNNDKLLLTLSKLNETSISNYDKAVEEFNQQIKKIGYESQEEFVQALESYLNKVDMKNVIDWLKGEGIINRDVAELLRDPSITPKDIATAYVKGKIATIAESLDRLKEGGSECAISDIICSVYEGANSDLNGHILNYTYSHSEKYYSQRRIRAFHEIIADFTALKMSGSAESLEQIRNIFGEEFYFSLDETFNKLLK